VPDLADVTVITPTIPGREDVLVRCLSSIYAQSAPPMAHIIVAQQQAVGIPRQVAVSLAQNQALSDVRTTWVLRCADDDWLTPLAIEKLLAAADDADIVYGPDRDEVAPMVDVNGYNPQSLAHFFTEHDTGQASGDLYRTKALRAIGGWPTEWTGNHFHHPMTPHCLHVFEDAAARAVLAHCGFRFKYIGYPTWVAGLSTPDRIGAGGMALRRCV